MSAHPLAVFCASGWERGTITAAQVCPMVWWTQILRLNRSADKRRIASTVDNKPSRSQSCRKTVVRITCGTGIYCYETRLDSNEKSSQYSPPFPKATGSTASPVNLEMARAQKW